MSVVLKPINQQVLFIVGATSELGVAIVRLAIANGARVFMLGKHEEDLAQLHEEMRKKNKSTAYAIADLTEVDQIQAGADQCLATFGTIDTWINLTEPLKSEVSARQFFDEGFWRVVYCSRAAINILKKTGGVLINLANLQSGMNVAEKSLNRAYRESIRGYTSELRANSKLLKSPISVSFISLENSGQLEELKYATKLVLDCAEHSNKEKVVGKRNVMDRMRETFADMNLRPLFRKKEKVS